MKPIDSINPQGDDDQEWLQKHIAILYVAVIVHSPCAVGEILGFWQLMVDIRTCSRIRKESVATVSNPGRDKRLFPTISARNRNIQGHHPGQSHFSFGKIRPSSKGGNIVPSTTVVPAKAP